MREKVMIGAYLLVLLYSCSIISWAQERGWRGIEPLISTREDVERLLGKCHQARDDGCLYEQERELILVLYSSGPCETGWPFGYQVPLDTVIRIEVSPKSYLHVDDLSVDLGPFEKRLNQDGSIMYVNTEQDIGIEVFDGKVGRFIYGPSKKQAHLRCDDLAKAESEKGTGVAGAHARLFEYGELKGSDEILYLDAFAKALLGNPNTKGFIITYGGEQSFDKEAYRRLQCQKEYLIKRHGIGQSRLSIIDGGFRKNRTVELFVLPQHGSIPLPFPTIRPSRVKILQDDIATTNLILPCSKSH